MGNEYTQYMFLWRTDESYPIIITKFLLLKKSSEVHLLLDGWQIVFAGSSLSEYYGYHIYTKYWDTLTPYYTSPKI